MGASPARSRDWRGVPRAVPVLLADGAYDAEAYAASAGPVRAGRASGIHRLVDGVVGRGRYGTRLGCVLQADDSFRVGVADHRLLLLAVAGAGRHAARDGDAGEAVGECDRLDD